MEKLEIMLKSEDMAIVQDAIAGVAAKHGVGEAEAAKILLGWGVAIYRQQAEADRRQAIRQTAQEQETALRQTGKFDEASKVRVRAMEAGQSTRQAVEAYLGSLTDTELTGTVAEVQSSKTARARMKTREAKIQHIASRICQGDAFLQR